MNSLKIYGLIPGGVSAYKINKIIGSGALSGKMLDLGSLAGKLEGYFFSLLFVPVGGSNPAGPYPNTFLTFCLFE